MGHSDYKILPVDKLCDIYLPQSKIAIIILKRNLKNIVEDGPNCSTKFMIQNLKEQGQNPIVINHFELDKLIKLENHQNVVSFLEQISI
jgi:hypothetical protein